MSTWESTLSPDEASVYKEYFNKAAKSQPNIVTAMEAVQFFAKSGLSNEKLSEIWEKADHQNAGYLTPETFAIAMKLIACAQHNIQPTEPVLTVASPLPTFAGIDPSKKAVPQSSLINLPKAAIAPEDKKKYQAIYQNQHPTINGIPAEACKALFAKSRLPNDQLSQIWNLADIRKCGYLDETEFVIAMHYIAKLMDRSINTLPTILPPDVYLAASSAPETHILTSSPKPIASTMSPLLMQQRQQSRAQQIDSIGNMAFSGSASTTMTPTMPSTLTSSSATYAWDVTPTEKAQFDSFFHKLDKQHTGLLKGADAVDFFKNSKLPEAELAKIWDLADIGSKGSLDANEFAIAMHLIHKRLLGEPVPVVLPKTLIPPLPTVSSAFNTTTTTPVQQSVTMTTSPTMLHASPSMMVSSPLPPPPLSNNNNVTREVLPSSNQQQSQEVDLLGDFGNDDNRIAEETSQVNLLQNQIASTKQSTKDIKTQHKQASESFQALQQNKSDLHQQLTLIQQQAEESAEELKSVKAQLEEEQPAWSTLEAELTTAESELKQAQEQLAQLRQEYKDGQEENERLRRQVHDIQMDTLRITKELDDLHAMNQKKQEEAAARRKAKEQEKERQLMWMKKQQEEEEEAEAEKRRRQQEEEEQKEKERQRLEQERLSEESRIAEEARKAEEARLAEEARNAEEARLAEEAKFSEREVTRSAEIGQAEKVNASGASLLLEEEPDKFDDMSAREAMHESQPLNKSNEGRRKGIDTESCKVDDIFSSTVEKENKPSQNTHTDLLAAAFGAASAEPAIGSVDSAGFADNFVQESASTNTEESEAMGRHVENQNKEEEAKTTTEEMSDVNEKNPEVPQTPSAKVNKSAEHALIKKISEEEFTDGTESTEDFFDAVSTPIMRSASPADDQDATGSMPTANEAAAAAAAANAAYRAPPSSSSTDENEFILIDHPSTTTSTSIIEPEQRPENDASPSAEFNPAGTTTNALHNATVLNGENVSMDSKQPVIDNHSTQHTTPLLTAFHTDDTAGLTDSEEKQAQDEDDEPVLVRSMTESEGSDPFAIKSNTVDASHSKATRSPPPPPPLQSKRAESAVVDQPSITAESNVSASALEDATTGRNNSDDLDAAFAVKDTFSQLKEPPVNQASNHSGSQKKVEFENFFNDPQFTANSTNAEDNNNNNNNNMAEMEDDVLDSAFIPKNASSTAAASESTENEVCAAFDDAFASPPPPPPSATTSHQPLEPTQPQTAQQDRSTTAKTPDAVNTTEGGENKADKSIEMPGDNRKGEHQGVNHIPPSANSTTSNNLSTATNTDRERGMESLNQEMPMQQQVKTSSAVAPTTMSTALHTEDFSTHNKVMAHTTPTSNAGDEKKKKKKKGIVKWAKSFGGFDFPSLDSDKKKKKAEKKDAQKLEGSSSGGGSCGSGSHGNQDLSASTGTIGTTASSRSISSTTRSHLDPSGNNSTTVPQTTTMQNSHIAELVNMGFDPAAAKEALDRYDQDVEKATNFLLDQA